MFRRNKIAIVTIYGNNNYGNRLQNYALQQILKQKNKRVYSIVPEKYNKYLLYLIRQCLRYIPETLVSKIKNKNIQRKIRFEKFNTKRIKIKWCFSKRRCFSNKVGMKFDCFIVGSDQVWNPLFWGSDEIDDFANNYFLLFANTYKRNSYAASVGIAKIPNQYIDIFKNGIKHMNKLLVREENAVDICSKFGRNDAALVLDPVFLLNKCEWMNLENDVVNNSNYMLLYFLGSKCEDLMWGVTKLANSCGCEIVDLMDENCIYYSYGPEIFIELIHKAKCVITDSFHAIAFSIIYNTPFYVVNREQNGQEDMSSRIVSILKETHLEDRMIDYSKLKYISNFNCDFSNANNKLKILKKNSLMEINKIFEGTEDE